MLLGVAQTCRTCFAKAAGAAQQGQYEYVILQVSFSLRVGTGSRCVSCAGSWCDGQCRCAPRWAAPLWGHALRGHARQCQWTRVDSLARCLVCVVCRCVSSGWGIVRCCAPRSGGSWQDLPYSQYRRIPISSSIPSDSSLRGRFTCVGSAVTAETRKPERQAPGRSRLTGFRRPLFPRKSAILLTVKLKIFVWLARRARSALRRFSVLRLRRAQVRRQSLHFPRITIIL